MAERRWQVSTYITDEKVYNDLKVYLMENNTTMNAALGAGLKALLAGKIDLDGNVIEGAKDEVLIVQSEVTDKESRGDACLPRDPLQPCQGNLGNTAEAASASTKDDALDNKMQKAWQAVVEAQQAAHKATFGNVDRAIDEWLVALTDALGVVLN